MSVITVRVYTQDAARRRHLIQTVRLHEWGAVAAYINAFSDNGPGYRYYEIEERADVPGDGDGE